MKYWEIHSDERMSAFLELERVTIGQLEPRRLCCSVFDLCGLGLEMIRSLENDLCVFLRHN
jgi:hypothetical protein